MKREFCCGCGIKLQTINPQDVGFIPLAVEKNNEYCKRCYALIHRNIVIENTVHTFLDPFANIKKEDVVILVVDAFEIDWSLTPIRDLQPQNIPFIVCINKIDKVNDSHYLEKLHEYIASFIKKTSLLIDTIAVSAKINYHINHLADLIFRCKRKNIWFIGETNVGKSAIINRLLEKFAISRAKLTESQQPFTTRNTIKIPILNQITLIDTPAWSDSNHLNLSLSVATRKQISDYHIYHPKTYQLKDLQTIFIQGFVRLDFIPQLTLSASIYTSPNLHLHRTKLEKAPLIFSQHQHDILHIPTLDEQKHLGSWKERKRIVITEPTEIVFQHLGFCRIVGIGEVIIHTYDNVSILIRKAII